MHKVNRLLFLSLVLLCSVLASAQSWIDVTDTYVKNPRFDNNDYSYWEGTKLGSANPFENAEHFGKTYDTYQVIKGLVPGKYRVSLDAFYRMGNSSNDYSLYSSGKYKDNLNAKLYATSSEGDYETSIVPLSSGALNYSLGGGVSTIQKGGSTYYFPNNMEGAFYWFDAGYYDNSVECVVGNNGELRIGVRKNTTISNDWTCIDNWALEYYGNVKKVTTINLSETSCTLAIDEKRQFGFECLPADATYKKVTWTSSNSSVVSVDDDGLICGMKVGNAVITATSIDGSGVKATCSITVKAANPAQEANIVINEIMASNIDVYRDPSTNFGPWVELYNPSTQGVKLGGLYVSDDPSNLKKYKLIDNYGVLSSKGYAILNFDHHDIYTPESYRQIDGKLDCDGGTVIISDGKKIIAQQEYPAAIGRVSYARTIDGGETWAYTGNPSPGSSNSVAGGFASIQLDAPIVDKDGCLFSGSLDVNVSIPSGATLVYTTDGTTPTLKNGNRSTTGSFAVSKTSNYRFRLFKDGYLPSKVVTRSYIIDNGNEPFPIISVVTDRNNIDGSTDYGVFKQGQYGRPGNGQTSKCNYNMDWDRPVNFEYITTDNECVVSIECDFSMCGGWSRAWTPHSFKLKANKVYDFQNTFDYQFFDEKPFLNNRTLQIRNGGNDTGNRIKDAAMQQIAARSGIYVDYQSWQPVHVYINGKSHGVLNMREPNNKHYAYANYGIDADDIEQFEISPDSGYIQMEGTGEYFRKLYNLSANAENEEIYEQVCNIVDIDEYINYMAIELYTGCTDWPQNNVKGFIDRNNGKFHFVLFDMDFALETNEPLNTFKWKQNYNFNSLLGYDYANNKNLQGISYHEEIDFVTIFLNLLKNETFKKKFIDSFCLVGGSVYTPERVREIVSEMSAYTNQGNYVNSSNTANSLINGFSNRLPSMISHIQSYFSLKSNQRQVVTLSSDTKGARLLVNDIEVPTGEFKGTLFAPITYKAVAPAGYEFAGWYGGSNGVKSTIFGTGSSWKYADTDISSTSWKTNISAFTRTGSAPLGYNSSNSMATSLQKNKITYYFGRSFSINDVPSPQDKFVLNFTVDDGVIVYVNGKEAGRYNMPLGNVGYNTVASSYAPGNPDTGSMNIDYSLFTRGTNYIAVEIHNNSSSSSDIYWDAELIRIVPSKEDADFISRDAEFVISAGGDYDLVACFDRIEEGELIAKGTTPIKINEISAANTMAVNDNFKKKDWIELYNTTTESIDIAGMYISDKEDNPKKYQIPSGVINTVIEPNGHIVLWADEKEGISQLHVPFKLGNEDGEKVILTSEDGSWKDVLTYTAHSGNQSVGLYPDGSNSVYVMDAPTIGKCNILDSYASFYMLYVPTEDEQGENAIASVDSDVIARSYYSVSGAYMGVDVDKLPRGVYVVKSMYADGRVASEKVLLK